MKPTIGRVATTADRVWRTGALLVLALAVTLFTGCRSLFRPAVITAQDALVRLSPAQYPTFDDTFGYDNLLAAIEQSRRYLSRLPAERLMSFGPDTYTVGHLKRSLDCFARLVAAQPTADRLNAAIRNHFQVYRSIGRADDGNVLFTGYYEPILNGFASFSPDHPIPIHSMPKDLVTIDLHRFDPDLPPRRLTGRAAGGRVEPYPDRTTISRMNDFDRIAPPLAWIADPVDRFFLQIQGSGKIYLDNGQMINAHYAGTNGHPYRSIGKLLIDEGRIAPADMSMQAIRRYLDRHPQDRQRILNANPSYVFFKIEAQGPLGALGVPLTPARAFASDLRLFPRGALAFVTTEAPLIDGNGRIRDWMPYNAFMLNQDTGGAIKGPARADLFWGNGPYARIAAGHLQHTGSLYFVVLTAETTCP